MMQNRNDSVFDVLLYIDFFFSLAACVLCHCLPLYLSLMHFSTPGHTPSFSPKKGLRANLHTILKKEIKNWKAVKPKTSLHSTRFFIEILNKTPQTIILL